MERSLNLFRQINIAVCAFAVAALLSGGVTTAQTVKAPSSAAAGTQTMEVTGQHRGFTNEKLFLKLDDGKEMTFVVDIPATRNENGRRISRRCRALRSPMSRELRDDHRSRRRSKSRPETGKNSLHAAWSRAC
jgi:hypothetical protein